MDIVLTQFSEAMMPVSDSDEANMPFDSSDTFVAGFLKGASSEPVFARRSSSTHYRIFTFFGTIGDPIPIEVDTFGKLRLWCRIAIEHRGWPYEMRAREFFRQMRYGLRIDPSKALDGTIGDDDCGPERGDEYARLL